jgi:rod shape-determining protein MreD
MTRRFVTLIVFGYALVVVQASLQAVLPLRIVAPELGLLVAIYAGLTAQNVSGACAVAFILGYVTDLLAGAPKGLHAMTFVIICLFGKGASLRLLLSGALMPAALAFVLSLLGGLIIVATRAGLVTPGSALGGPGLSPLAIAPLQAAMTALFAPLVFGFLNRILGRLRQTAQNAAMGRR